MFRGGNGAITQAQPLTYDGFELTPFPIPLQDPFTRTNRMMEASTNTLVVLRIPTFMEPAAASAALSQLWNPVIDLVFTQMDAPLEFPPPTEIGRLPVRLTGRSVEAPVLTLDMDED